MLLTKLLHPFLFRINLPATSIVNLLEIVILVSRGFTAFNIQTLIKVVIIIMKRFHGVPPLDYLVFLSLVILYIVNIVELLIMACIFVSILPGFRKKLITSLAFINVTIILIRCVDNRFVISMFSLILGIKWILIWILVRGLGRIIAFSVGSCFYIWE